MILGFSEQQIRAVFPVTADHTQNRHYYSDGCRWRKNLLVHTYPPTDCQHGACRLVVRLFRCALVGTVVRLTRLELGGLMGVSGFRCRAPPPETVNKTNVQHKQNPICIFHSKTRLQVLNESTGKRYGQNRMASFASTVTGSAFLSAFVSELRV